MSDEKTDDFKQIAVSLPARYWITVLGLADVFIRDKVEPQMKALQKKGAKPNDIPDATSAVLMGPLFARAAIVDALCEAGIMTPDAKASVGTDKLMEMAKYYFDKQRGGNGSK